MEDNNNNNRLIVTCGLCFLLNKSRKETINWKWQAVMVVGGLRSISLTSRTSFLHSWISLRGAIAFAMVAEYDGPYSARFYDCVIVVVLFTTLVQVGGGLTLYHRSHLCTCRGLWPSRWWRPCA